MKINKKVLFVAFIFFSIFAICLSDACPDGYASKQAKWIDVNGVSTLHCDHAGFSSCCKKVVLHSF
jgi:hypothetical protein